MKCAFFEFKIGGDEQAVEVRLPEFLSLTVGPVIWQPMKTKFLAAVGR